MHTAYGGAEDMMVISCVFAWKHPKVGFYREGNLGLDF